MKEFKNLQIRSIEFLELGLKYEGSAAIFENLSLSPPMGKVVRVHGAAGAGKSTLLKIMAGLVAPTSGDYKINGESIAEMTFTDLIPYRLRIGYSFEMGGLLSNRTIAENLKLPLQFHQLLPIDQIELRVQSLLEYFGLEDVANTRPSEVSGSRRKAAIVARSLVADPDLLLLDDPTTGLSDENRKNLCMYIVAKRSEGQLQNVFVVSDDQKFCDDIIESTFVINKTGIIKAA